MTPRADFLAVLLRNQRRMDSERRAFAERVSDVVAVHIKDRETFDVLAYTMISRDLEPIFREWYGIAPNDTRARYLKLIQRECRKAKAVPIQRAVADVRRRLERYPEVLRAIRSEVA